MHTCCSSATSCLAAMTHHDAAQDAPCNCYSVLHCSASVAGRSACCLASASLTDDAQHDSDMQQYTHVSSNMPSMLAGGSQRRVHVHLHAGIMGTMHLHAGNMDVPGQGAAAAAAAACPPPPLPEIDWSDPDQVAGHVSSATLTGMQQLWRRHAEAMDTQGQSFAQHVYRLHTQTIQVRCSSMCSRTFTAACCLHSW
jgi:hypothetical protein